MKAKDLIILLFPGDKHDSEVNKGGEALFVKHVRKHLVGRGKDDTKVRGLVEARGRLAEARDADKTLSGPAFAQRAWLIRMNNESSLLGDGPVERGKDYEILAETDPFTPGKFDPDTGVYVINHAVFGIMQLFGVTGMNASKLYPDNNVHEAVAGGLIGIFKKLGINNCRKVAFAACSLADHAQDQKSFLQEFVVGMHVAGYKTKVAGWDIPFEIVADPQDDAYGRKRGTGAHYKEKFLKDLRGKNKFVYLYQSGEIAFGLSKEKSAIAANVSAAETKAEKDFKKGHNPLPLTWKAGDRDRKEDGKKVGYSYRVDFVDKVKFAKSGWSD